MWGSSLVDHEAVSEGAQARGCAARRFPVV